jgi:hypothetical protein
MTRLFRTCSVVLALAVGMPSARAQDPAGLFCSCPPTLTTGSGSVLPSLTGKDFLAGFLVRIGWSDLEPQKGAYAWALPDSQFARARRAGKRVTLAIVNGPMAPAWLSADGAQSFSYSFRGSTTTMPVPWDPVHLARWTDLIRRVGERYRAEPHLALVHMTHATANGFEMQLPFTPTDQSNWHAIGFSHRRVIDAWKTVMDAFRDAFPTTPLDVDVHPVLASDSVSRGVVEYGSRSIGRRFGVFAAWWSQRNTVVYAPQYQLLLGGVDSSFAGVQLVASGTTDSAQFGAGGLPAALDLAQQNGIHYWEVWNQDLLNPAFEQQFRQLAEMVSSVGSLRPAEIDLLVLPPYPNPARHDAVLPVRLRSEQTIDAGVFDLLGREVQSLIHAPVTGDLLLPIQTSFLTPGLYILRVTSRAYNIQIPLSVVH